MSPAGDRVEQTLEHLVRLAAVDKAYAWWAAKNYAQLNPFELGDMPRRLIERMKQTQEKN